MDLRQLGYVVAVAEQGSFTRAAAASHVSQPALSQSVKALEAELGIDLFHRTSRSVVLTDAGTAILEPARQALRDAANARAAVAAVQGLDRGQLDLVCLPTLAVHPATELIGRFRRLHPGINVRVVEPEDADDVFARVRNGSSEIGMAELPAPTPDLVSHLIETQEFVALIPKAFTSASAPGGKISLQALSEQPLIASPKGTSMRRQLDEAFGSAGLVATVAVETAHRESIGPLVAAGAGIAVLPRRVAKDTSANVVIAEITPPMTRMVGLIHRNASPSPAAQAFLDVAQASFPAQSAGIT